MTHPGRAEPAGRLVLPDPPLAVDELVLRPWSRGDAGALVTAWHDPEIARWNPVPDARDLDAAQRWIEREPGRRELGLALDLVVVEAAAPELVLGEVGLSSFDPARRGALVGYWMAAPARRRRVATRALAALAAWATDPDGPLALVALVARCDPANAASHGVAIAAGFEPRSRDRDGFELFVAEGGPRGRRPR